MALRIGSGAGGGLVQPEIDFVRGVDSAFLVEGGGNFGRGAVVSLNGLRSRAELRHRRAEREARPRIQKFGRFGNCREPEVRVRFQPKADRESTNEIDRKISVHL